MQDSDLLYDAKTLYRSNLEELPVSGFCRLTSFLRIMPDFFIGGVQKGGTTSLYAALAQHPQIIRAKFKEVFYYGNNDNYQKGKAHYKQFFATSFHKQNVERKLGKQVLTLDATTNTFESKEAPKRILQDNPKAKIIFILRNPVERAFSQYKMSQKKGWEKASFEKALELEEARIADGAKMASGFNGHNYAFQRLGYRSRGLYVNYMKQWFAEFPKENILVLNSDSFFQNPDAVFDNICQFLKIDDKVNIKFDKLNEGAKGEMEEKTRAYLSNYFKPYNEELFTLIKTRYDW